MPPVLGRQLPPPPPLVRVVGAATLPVEVLDAAPIPVEVLVSPLPAGAATEAKLAEVAALAAANVAATTAGLEVVASTAAANSALLLAATNLVAAVAAENVAATTIGLDTVASTAAANSALLLTATNTVATVAAENAAATVALLAAAATELTLGSVLTAITANPPVSVNNFPATQPVSGSVSNTPVQNSGKTVNRFVLSQVGAAGTALIAAASPGNKHKVIGVVLSMSAAGTVRFTDTVNLMGAMNLTAGAIFNVPPNPTFPLVETLANRALSIVTTGGGANGVVLYLTES